MEKLPLYLHLVFGATTLLSVFLFYKATNRSKISLLIIGGWLLLQSIIGLSGFYTVSDIMPPGFLLLVLPPLMAILFLFMSEKGRMFIDRLDAKSLTLLHV